MSGAWPCLMALCAMLCASVYTGRALAAPPSEQTLACVSASTEGQEARDRGRLLAARARFRACAQAACPGIVRKSCSDWLVDLEPRIPSLVVRVVGPHAQDLPQASLEIDGQAVELDGRPRELEAGPHELVARAPGLVAVQRTVLLAEREQSRLVVIELEPALQPAAPAAPVATVPLLTAPAQPREDVPPAPAYRVPVGSWIVGGLGVAGIASFAVLRVKAGQELQELQGSCAPDCSDASTQHGRNMAIAADVSLGVGVAALAGACAWVLGSWLSRGRVARRDGATSAHSRVLAGPLRGGAFVGAAATY